MKHLIQNEIVYLDASFALLTRQTIPEIERRAIKREVERRLDAHGFQQELEVGLRTNQLKALLVLKRENNQPTIQTSS